MTQEQADENSNKLMEFLRQKIPDLKAHIDLINGTDKIGYSGSFCASDFGVMMPSVSVQTVPIVTF